ncbi:hypothetical protein CALCODRAFT_505013 [Calocera cornea HHB12733]|uniref:F-box domain-containing protein n=1 Tax=Calocera cornea HHB12733 TaxID=1353952 RepID=A0A165C2F1_9BASI|nr:hypothetical protein CALCODRAFT_505013 [Calocera cornea HHB12733]
MDGLPSEILRCILREATLIRDGFTYPTEVDTRVQEKPALLRITEAMQVKCAISLVSKRFHALGDEFLLEILHIGQQKHIPALLAVLRQQRNENGVTRGWWCRRLIVNLRQSDIEWGHGNASLWGLIPSCPRLEDLRCFLFHTVRRRLHRRRLDLYRVTVVFCQTIASTLGRSLRYLQFGDHMEMSVQLATSLLPHLKVLEVCRFDRFVAPNSASNDNRPRWRSTKAHYKEDECPIDEAVAEEYHAATEMVDWSNTAQTVTLTALRIFKANAFFADFGHWKMPNLHEVIVGFDRDCMSEDTLPILRKALVPHAAHISRLTFEGGGGGSLWMILDMLPGLKKTRFGFQCINFTEALTRPHTSLTSLVITLRPFDSAYLLVALSSIQETISEGLLPCLETIDLEGSEKDGRVQILQVQKALAGLGVSLTMTYV